MKVLAVKQPWASLIAHNDKDMEIRSQDTKIRGRLAIYASRTAPSSKDMDHVKQLFTDVLQQYVPEYLKPENLEYGKILATAELFDSDQMTPKDWADNTLFHFAPKEYFKEGHTYAWHLTDIERLEYPIEFKMPKGAVVWANAEVSL